MVFVNLIKKERAEKIYAFLNGSEIAKDKVEADLADRFAKLCAEAKVDEKGKLEFIYVKLGGLVRTEEQQRVAEAKKKEIQNRKGKKAIE